MHSRERADLLHALRWDRAAHERAIEHIRNSNPKKVLVGILDGIFKIECAIGAGASIGAVRTHLGSALNDLCGLLEQEQVDENDVIDVGEEAPE